MLEARERNRMRLRRIEVQKPKRPRTSLGMPCGIVHYVEPEPVDATGETKARLARALEMACAQTEELTGRAGKPYPLPRYTEADYAAMHADQDGKCAICSTPRSRLSVDHDHITGKNRGLLCSQCNWGLGQFRDNPQLLENAIRYLKENADGG